MLARPARRATYHRALRSGELIPQNERELRRSEGSGTITELWGAERLGRSEGSGMLIGDPLVEGSSASSTDGELWRAENSFLGMRGTQLPKRSSRAENSLLRVRPITSSGEWRTHSSEWEGTPPLRRERQAQPWALESGELIPQNERELRRSQGSASRRLAGNFHLTSVGGVYGGYRGIREEWEGLPLSDPRLCLTLAAGGGGAWVARLAF